MDTGPITGRLFRAGHRIAFSAKPYRGPGDKLSLRGFWTVTATIDPPLPRDGDPASLPMSTCSASAATDHNATLQITDKILTRLDAIAENCRRLASESLRLAREYRADAESYDGEAAKYADESR